MFIISIAAVLCIAVLVITWVAAIIDMSRRTDISGLKMALWIGAIVLFPIVGIIAYVLSRPPADQIQYRGQPPE